ncbi:Hypothetical Protein FCC1311_079802 [Hondaea fermentalgiana]|uniref:Uncharacterized protein n=1 Tax=Hondaea fermentalgiana TaxID=2315210 RepID=A0A2R5GM97_9STRA|nr:Hypothetical Protein FCC1311_079802 [Hondaea fermentalgiana]|eukprot:GBG31755.1 Hypothetical Protein FCC1311_079802 [Hondaea fermentalgiana]
MRGVCAAPNTQNLAVLTTSETLGRVEHQQNFWPCAEPPDAPLCAIRNLTIRDEDLKFSPLMLRDELTGVRQRAADTHDVTGLSQADSEATDRIPATPQDVGAQASPQSPTENKAADSAPSFSEEKTASTLTSSLKSKPSADQEGVSGDATPTITQETTPKSLQVQEQEQATPANVPEPSAPAQEPLVAGDTVTVLPYKLNGSKGRDALHGAGIVKGVSEDGTTVDVKFVLGGRNKRVPRDLVVTFDATGEMALIAEAKRASLGRNHVPSADSSTSSAIAEPTEPKPKEETSQGTASSIPNSSAYVRRSYRCNGLHQLRSARVVKLLDRLWANDPDDTSLKVLRLKNHIDADSNKQVIMEVLDALEQNNVVQALYIQNMEEAMDDETLGRLTEVLRANSRIWALNVGENYRVSREGWEQFAEDLAHTYVTHLYAGSETTVYGALKVRMRNVIRSNRIKHRLHNSPDNVEVIAQIGQMWWNPRNAKALQPHLPSEAQKIAQVKVNPLVGRKVVVTVRTETQVQRRLGRVVKYNDQHNAHLIAWIPIKASPRSSSGARKPDIQEGSWLSLEDLDVLVSGPMAWGRPKDIITADTSASTSTSTSASTSASTSTSPNKRTREDIKEDTPLVTPTKKAKRSSEDRSLGDGCLDLWFALTSIPACKPFLTASNRRKRQRDYTGPRDLMTIRVMARGLEYATMSDFADDIRTFFQHEVNAGDASDVKLTGFFASMSVAQLAKELMDSFERELVPALEKYGRLTQTHRPSTAKKQLNLRSQETPVVATPSPQVQAQVHNKETEDKQPANENNQSAAASEGDQPLAANENDQHAENENNQPPAAREPLIKTPTTPAGPPNPSKEYEPIQIFWPNGQKTQSKGGKIMCLFLSDNENNIVSVPRRTVKPWAAMKAPAYVPKDVMKFAESEECLYCYANNMLCT